jgi:TfoX/Sxy family transcriptional regulator of competence genes
VAACSWPRPPFDEEGRAAATDDSFTAFVIDHFPAWASSKARRMFGGRGLYWKEQIFGLIDEGRLYFRVTESSSVRYAAEGSKPFRAVARPCHEGLLGSAGPRARGR